MQHIKYFAIYVLLFSVSAFKIHGQKADTSQVSLSKLLNEKELISVSTIYHSGYSYNFEQGKMDVDYSYSARIKTQLPVFISKSKKWIALTNVNFMRTWFNLGAVHSNGNETVSSMYSETYPYNDYINVVPSVMYRFNIFGKSAYAMGRFGIYGDSFMRLKNSSMDGMFSIKLTHTKDYSLGVGFGVMVLNNNDILAFPTLSLKRNLQNNFYLSTRLPYDANLIYLPSGKWRFEVGTGLDIMAHIFPPRTENVPELQLKDLGLLSKIEIKRQVYKPVWIKGKVGFNTIFQSKFSRLSDGETVSKNKSYSNFMSEISLSVQF